MTTVHIDTTGCVLIDYDTSLLARDRQYNHEQHERFFEKFTNSWLPLIWQGRYKDAEKVWKKALEITSACEAQNNNSIHKGTPYYFYGMTCILGGDLDMGFYLMHQALEEDRKTIEATRDTRPIGTPAYLFVTMNNTNQNQAFYREVQAVAAFVELRLSSYRKSRSANLHPLNLNMAGLRDKVLGKDALGDIRFFLIYNFFRLKKLLDAREEIRKNDFASLLQMQTLLGFCIVAEGLMKKEHGKKKLFACLNKLIPLQSKKGEINKKFNENFEETLGALLASDNKPSTLEKDLLILYSIRNTSAHNINSSEIIYKNFDKVPQSVLNALFYIIEKSNL